MVRIGLGSLKTEQVLNIHASNSEDLYICMVIQQDLHNLILATMDCKI
jgi:hypothetical protein